MVLRRLRVTRRKGVKLIPAGVGAACLSLMVILSGGDGRREGIIFVEASSGRTGFLSTGAGGFWPSNVGIALAVTAMAGVALAATLVYSRRGSLKSPWSHRRRKHALLPKQWKSLFNSDGRLCDGGVKFLKKVRSGGVDPSIRAEVWPFLLGVYDMNSSKEERDSIKTQKRKEYDNLRRQCQQMAKPSDKSFKLNETSGNQCGENSGDLGQVLDSPDLEQVGSPTGSISAEGGGDPDLPVSDVPFKSPDTLSEEGGDESGITCENASEADSESSDSDSSEETDNIQPFIASEGAEENKLDDDAEEKSTSSESQGASKSHAAEDFSSWRRIIRLDAVRANAEWVIYSPSQAEVSETKAQELAESVGLKDFDHLEPCRIFHAARLVAILEAYALNFEQTLCLWEVMWADQAAIRAGIAKSASGRMKLRAHPSDDLLLYAIAACVLQRRKLIIEKYNSMGCRLGGKC